ncbi:MAG: hypothetical protein ACK55Z_01650, partial [bacterium]
MPYRHNRRRRDRRRLGQDGEGARDNDIAHVLASALGHRPHDRIRSHDLDWCFIRLELCHCPRNFVPDLHEVVNHRPGAGSDGNGVQSGRSQQEIAT